MIVNRKFRRKILEIKNVFDEKEIRNLDTKTKFIQRESSKTNYVYSLFMTPGGSYE